MLGISSQFIKCWRNNFRTLHLSPKHLNSNYITYRWLKMRKLRNSIYRVGLASLLYLGCGNSVQNKDIKIQEDTDLGFADRLNDGYGEDRINSTDLGNNSSLEDRINPIDLRELDYISIEDSSLEIQEESDILPDSLEYYILPDLSLNDLSRDDYSIDLGTDYANEDTSLSNDLNYCNSLEINSPEWCENCNTAPVLENAYLRDPKPSYAIGEDIYVCVEASDPEGDELICRYSNGPKRTENNCTECGWIDFFVEGPQTIWTWAEDTCNNQSEAYLITIEIK